MIKINIVDKSSGDRQICCSPEKALQEFKNLSNAGMLIIDLENQQIVQNGKVIDGHSYIASYPISGG